MPTEAPNIFLSIAVEREGEVCVVHCRGKLVSGSSSYLHKEVYPLIANSKLIVLDLAGLEWVDSMGLGALVRLQAVSRKNGSELQLRNLGLRVRQILELTNLIGVFSESGGKDVS